MAERLIRGQELIDFDTAHWAYPHNAPELRLVTADNDESSNNVVIFEAQKVETKAEDVA